MICEEARSLIHGYADGELDLAGSMEIEAHLNACPMCARELASLRLLSKSLGDPALYHAAPKLLADEIRASLGATPIPRRQLPWRTLAIAASILFFIALAALTIHSTAPTASQIAQHITSAHVRSMMANHLADVASTDQHTVKPWFNGKLDFSPPVIDLAEQGFPLLGGRLDYIEDHAAAALIYKRHQHVINLFVWPDTSTADSVPTQMERQGYHLLHWANAGMNFWAVSDLNFDELKQFAALIRPRPATRP
jgi:anti-sigma factor RsiW